MYALSEVSSEPVHITQGFRSLGGGAFTRITLTGGGVVPVVSGGRTGLVLG